MDESEKLLHRRKKFTPNGLGMITPITVRSASGSVAQDLEGRSFIDFASGIGVTTAGHCPPPVVAAIKAQAESLIHTCFMVATYPAYVDLAEELAGLFPHGEETKVLLTNSGAESVENAVKIARQATGRPAIIGYSGAFHGRTMMGMTLTSKVGYKYNCGPFAPEVYRLPFPDYYHEGGGLSLDRFVVRELDRVRDAFYNLVSAQSTAAVIMEPILGEGGFVPAPAAYLRGLREICDEHGILLIMDEVQSGFCRTGKWACYEHAGITPDLSTWAKAMGSGMPIGAVIGRADIMDAAAPGTVGGTYPGNPVTCAASLATIQFMKDRDLNQRARHIGKLIRTAFARMAAFCPGVGDVRGLGAMMAIEFVRDGQPDQPDGQLCEKLLKACWEKGLLIIPAGTHKNIIRILVPLVIEDDTLARGLSLMEESLHEVWRNR